MLIENEPLVMQTFADKSRLRMKKLLDKAKYKVTPTVGNGKSREYWIIYCADKENKESRLKKGNWSLI